MYFHIIGIFTTCTIRKLIEMKYRRLTIEELEELESEFVRFLASNSITADDWVKIKEDKTDQAEGLIEMFSDLVFDKILSNVEYLEHKRKADLRVYKFLDEKILMVGLMVDGADHFDFSKDSSPEEMLSTLQQSGGKIQSFSGEKKYKFSKEKEIFLIMEEGALISKDPLLFNTISSVQKQ